MQAKIVDQQSSIAALHENYERSKQEAKKHQEQVSVLARQLHEREREINNLKEKFNEEQSPQQCSAQKDMIIEQHQATSSLEQNNVEMGISADLEADNTSLKAENSSLKNLKIFLEAKIQTLEKEIEAKRDDKIVQALQHQNAQTSQELESLKKRLIKVCEGQCQLNMNL